MQVLAGPVTFFALEHVPNVLTSFGSEALVSAYGAIHLIALWARRQIQCPAAILLYVGAVGPKEALELGLSDDLRRCTG